MLLVLAFVAFVALAIVAVSAFGANSAPRAADRPGASSRPAPTSATYPPEPPAPAPAKGMKRQQGDGFTIDVPAGFGRAEKRTQVAFSAKGKASVRVAKVEIDTDLLKTIEVAEAKQPYEGYALIRIAPLEESPYEGADTAEWEYAYEGKDGLVHVISRWVGRPGRGAYADLLLGPRGRVGEGQEAEGRRFRLVPVPAPPRLNRLARLGTDWGV